MAIDVADDVMSARSFPVRVEQKAPRSVSERHEGSLVESS